MYTAIINLYLIKNMGNKTKDKKIRNYKETWKKMDYII